MELKVIKYDIINIKCIKNKHGVKGDIITTTEYYNPMYVLASYFEQQYIDEFGLDSEQLLYHGTNYIDCIDLNGCKYRLNYYEYAIIKHSKRLYKQFNELFKL